MSGLAWAAVAALGPRVATFGTTLVLARWLTPDQMGQTVLIATALAGLGLARDFGLPAALLARRDAWDADAAAAPPLLLAHAGLLAGGLALAAPTLAAAFGSPDLAAPLACAGAIALAANLGVVPAAALDRRQARRARAAAEGAGALAYIGGAVVAAGVSTGSVMGVALGPAMGPAWIPWGAALAQAVVTSGVLRAAAGPLPAWRLGATWRPLLAFGAPLAAAQLAVFAFGYFDNLAIGRWLGPAALASYALAYALANLPAVAAQAVASRWLFPRYVAAPAGELPGLFLGGFGAVAAAVLPAAMGLVLYARPLVELLFGAGWQAAVAPLQVLAAYGAARALGATAADVLLALGLPGLVRRGLGFQLLAGVPALALGIAAGTPAAVGAALTVVLLGSAIAYLRAAAGQLGLGLAPLAAAMARPAVAAIAMALPLAPGLAPDGVWIVQAATSAVLAALVLAWPRRPWAPLRRQEARP